VELTSIPARVERPDPPPLDQAHRNRCHLVTYPVRGSESRHLTFESSTARTRTAAAPAGPLRHFRYIRWDGTTRRKQLEVVCVVAQSVSVMDLLSMGFPTELDQAIGRNRPGPEQAIHAWTGIEPMWDGSVIWCANGTEMDIWICEGVPCTNGATLRAAAIDQIAANAVYECANGCLLSGSANIYECPGGVGDIDWDWGGGGDPPVGGGGGGPGGGGPSVAHDDHDDSELSYCDTTCNLEDAHDLQIDSLIPQINQLPAWARDLLLEIIADTVKVPVVRGNDTLYLRRFQVWTNTIPDPSDSTAFIAADVHRNYELTGLDPRSRFHWYMGDLWKNVLIHRTLCHEAAHVFGLRHGPEHTAREDACVAGGPEP